MPVIKDAFGAARFVPEPDQPPEPVNLSGMIDDEEKPTIAITEDGTQVTTLPDGSVIIGKASAANENTQSDSFDENLSEKWDSSALSTLAADLLDGIETDIRSRSQMVGSYQKGIDLLGLKIEDRSKSRMRKNTSTIRHPVLLEAIVKFQSAARAEMLPAAGPCKVKNDAGSNAQSDELAQQLEDDINHYLTVDATEYYPDTDRGLFYLGYGGTIFKKVYKCPLRRRAVSECVYLTDLIVSENATDLVNAIRVTHRIEMTRNDVKRMQAKGIWRDIALSTPSPQVEPAKERISQLQGITRTGLRPQDMQHTIYECYCEIIPEDYGLSESAAPDGLPLPYRVTLDKDSRVILDVRRLWAEDDEDYKKKLPFVMYGLIPGMGFLCYGFLHLLGNQTLALTAIWRILVDAGMFNNFPGGVRIKGTRQSTNEIQPGPGEFPEIDTGPAQSIKDAIMPLPYKEPSAVFIQLAEIISQDAQRMAGAIEMEVGEGRTNVPVGTIMAMIEQQTQVMAAVHKRLHTSQMRELILLKELFTEDPEMLWRTNPKARQWNGEELKDMLLVPASDPNIPAQTHRIMQATALIQLASQNPDIYDKIKVHERALKTIGISDTSEILHPPAPPAPDPMAAMAGAELQAKQADTQVKMAGLQQKTQQQQREAADRVVQSQEKDKELAAEAQRDALDRQSTENIAKMQEETERLKLLAEIKNKDREHMTGIAGNGGF